LGPRGRTSKKCHRTTIYYRGFSALFLICCILFQAEELNSIVGNAFRMAYAAQLQKQPTFQDVIASQLDQTQTNKVLWVRVFNDVDIDRPKTSDPL
jgi:hypothetical protein